MSDASVSGKPILLRALVAERHMQRYESFRTWFENAARALAEHDKDPGLASATISKRQYERWLSGRLTRQPHPDARRVLEHMFSRTVDELFSPVAASTATAVSKAAPAALAPPAPPPPQLAAPTLDPGVIVEADTADDGVRPRMLLRGLLGDGSVRLPARALEAIETIRRSMDATMADEAGQGMLDEWERRADEYTSAYLVTPPAHLLQDALLDFIDVQAALKHGHYGRQRARLWRLTAVLAGLVGVCLYVLGQYRDARAWYVTGRRASELCKDTRLHAWMYVRSAAVSLHYGTPSSALELADKAAQLLREPSGTAVRAHLIRSRALARMNDRINARHALDQGRSCFEAADVADASDKAFGYTERQFLAHAANAMTTVRDTKAAQRFREQAFAGFAAQVATEPLDPALARIDEGWCLLWESDPTQACRHVIDSLVAVPAEHRTGLIHVYTRMFANALTPDQQRLNAAVELNEVLRTAFTRAQEP